jgi:hypothetical protein
MATRLYWGGTITDLAAIGVDASFEVNSLATDRLLVRTSAEAVGFGGGSAPGSGVSNQDVAFRRFLIRLGPNTFSGTFKAQAMAREHNAATDARTQQTVRVLSPNGSVVRGVVIGHDTGGLSQEWVPSTTDSRNAKFPRAGATAVSTVTSYNGDWLEIVLGWRNHGTNTSAVQINSFGGASAADGDLPEDETTRQSTSDCRAWFEFSQDLTFWLPPLARRTYRTAVHRSTVI